MVKFWYASALPVRFKEASKGPSDSPEVRPLPPTKHSN